MRYQDDSSESISPRLKLKEGVSRSPFEQRIAVLEQKLSELASVLRYQDDSLEAAPVRIKRQERVSRSPLEQRIAMLERKVSELSKVINGLTVQLAEVSSVVRDIKRPVAVQDDVELRVKKGEVKKGGKPEKKGKTEYIIAENDYPIQEQRKSKGNIVVADRDQSS
jgi:uncharacterized coiled-coil protein SlyX